VRKSDPIHGPAIEAFLGSILFDKGHIEDVFARNFRGSSIVLGKTQIAPAKRRRRDSAISIMGFFVCNAEVSRGVFHLARSLLTAHSALNASTSNYGSAKVKSADPAATATYCLPSMANDMGEE